jgi:protein-disulfide isomerase
MLRVPVTPRDHILGAEDASITLVEYGDYECPACGLAHPTVRRVQEHFAENLRFVFRHFPLQQVHPDAGPAAETAEFAAAHDEFWQMHDALYENQDRLGLPLFLALARQLGLSQTDLRAALETGEYEAKVRADFSGGVRSGVNGTPTFFINGYRHEGSFAFEELAAAIAMQLRMAAPV